SEASLTRPEMQSLLRRGKAELLAAMSPTPQVLERGEILVQMEEPHEFLYAIETGWLSRSRTLPDGRRQIIVLFLPSEVCGIKTIFMTHQPDAIEALTPASARRIHYKAACELAAREFGVAMLLAWQLAQDERHLHNWNVRLGRANGEERLAAFLLELRNRRPSRRGTGRALVERESHTRIAGSQPARHRHDPGSDRHRYCRQKDQTRRGSRTGSRGSDKACLDQRQHRRREDDRQSGRSK